VGGADGVVLSGADGTYRLGQLAADRYNILVRASDEFLRSWTYEELDNVPLMPGQDLAGQDLKLVRGAAIAGKVLTADTREPVAGVSVLVQGSPYGRRPDRRWDLATGEDGGYLLRVPPGEYVVSLRPFAPSQWVNPKTLVVVTAEDGATAAADFELPRNTAPFVRGVVVGPDGQPARQARVSISSRVGISSGQTDGEGRFAVRLPVAEGGTLTASLEGAWPSVGVPVRGGEDLRVELRPAPAAVFLVGMVNDEQGLPIAGSLRGTSKHGHAAGAGAHRTLARAGHQRRANHGQSWRSAARLADQLGGPLCDPHRPSASMGRRGRRAAGPILGRRLGEGLRPGRLRRGRTAHRRRRRCARDRAAASGQFRLG
jgi:hypothetical protein